MVKSGGSTPPYSAVKPIVTQDAIKRRFNRVLRTTVLRCIRDLLDLLWVCRALMRIDTGKGSLDYDGVTSIGGFPLPPFGDFALPVAASMMALKLATLAVLLPSSKRLC